MEGIPGTSRSNPTERSSQNRLREVFPVTQSTEHTPLLPPRTDASSGTQEAGCTEYGKACYEGLRKYLVRAGKLFFCLREETTEVSVSMYQGQESPSLKDNPDMINVDMNSYGITKADHSHPILKTYGLGPCTGIVLYHPGKKIAGIFHVNGWDDNELDEDVNALLDGMYRQGLTGEDKKTLQANIIGGRAMSLMDDSSEENLDKYDRLPATKACLQKLEIKNILFEETEDTARMPGGRSIAIDSRTGKIYNLTDLLPQRILHESMCLRADKPHVTFDDRSLDLEENPHPLPNVFQRLWDMEQAKRRHRADESRLGQGW